MRAHVFQASVIAFATMPLVLATFAACGDDSENGAFGGGDAASSSATTTIASTGTPASATSAATTSQSGGGNGDGGGGGDGGSGGGDGGSTSDGGGGSSDGGGGMGQGGEGGSAPITCDDGCTPSLDPGADCDDDGDPNDTDCQPCLGVVFSGQTEYFDNPYALFGSDGVSFDYDCSGALAFEYEYVPGGCSELSMNQCDAVSIYTGGDAPVCGEEIFVQDCDVTGIVIGNCANDGAGTNMMARCH